jgi:hypothetical protein
MQTVTVDLLNEYAINLLKDLEVLRLIRVRKERTESKKDATNLVAKYKGAMSKQPLQEINQQLNDIRNEWN